MNIEWQRVRDFAVTRLHTMASTAAGDALGFLGGALGSIFEFLFTLFTMFYLFRDAERIIEKLRESLPLEREQTDRIFKRTRDVIEASVNGMLIIAAIQGALGALAFWVLGVPAPILWGVMMFFFSLIPSAGAFVVWLPIAVALLLTGDWNKALALTLFGAFVISAIDNFLRPKPVGDKVRLHPLIIFFTVSGGLQLFGVIGIALGPLIVAVTLALFDFLRQTENSLVISASGAAQGETRHPESVGGDESNPGV